MPTTPRTCPVCSRTVIAMNSMEYRDNPDSQRVTSTVVHYECQCGNLFTCSFAAHDRNDGDANYQPIR
jgi:hypothetical protein